MIVVKLESFPLKEVVKLPKKHWWKVAHQRATCTISSIADPKYMMLRRLQNHFVDSVRSTPGVEQHEKQISSFNEYYK